MTTIELAAQLGIVNSHISQIETGDRMPSLPLAIKLSKLTGIPVEDFERTEAQS